MVNNLDTDRLSSWPLSCRLDRIIPSDRPNGNALNPSLTLLELHALALFKEVLASVQLTDDDDDFVSTFMLEKSKTNRVTSMCVYGYVVHICTCGEVGTTEKVLLHRSTRSLETKHVTKLDNYYCSDDKSQNIRPEN